MLTLMGITSKTPNKHLLRWQTGIGKSRKFSKYTYIGLSPEHRASAVRILDRIDRRKYEAD